MADRIFQKFEHRNIEISVRISVSSTNHMISIHTFNLTVFINMYM